jgi:hypothetical protein
MPLYAKKLRNAAELANEKEALEATLVKLQKDAPLSFASIVSGDKKSSKSGSVIAQSGFFSLSNPLVGLLLTTLQQRFFNGKGKVASIVAKTASAGVVPKVLRGVIDVATSYAKWKLMELGVKVVRTALFPEPKKALPKPKKVATPKT